MTRRNRREIERAVEDLTDEDTDADQDLTRGWRTVHRDPVTYRLYDGWGDDAAPVESLPEDKALFIHRRAVCMDREEAEREDREILEVVNDQTGAVSVRVEPADDVATEGAVVLPPEDDEIVVNLSGVDT